MRPEQKPIADWMREVMAKRGLSAWQWAKDAGLGRDTVSRAIRDDYTSVTSTRTLLALARAANVPPPDGVAAAAQPLPINELVEHPDYVTEVLNYFLPTADQFAPALPPILAAMGLPTPDEDDLLAGAAALRDVAIVIATELRQNDQIDPAHARTAARTAVLRFASKGADRQH